MNHFYCYVPNLRFDFGGTWERHKLTDVALFLPGLTYSPKDIRKDGKIVLRSSNIQDGLLDLNDIVCVDKEIVKSNLSIKPYDVLMCIRNGSKKLVGKTALIVNEDPNLTWGAFMAIIRPIHKSSFIFHYLNSQSFFKQIFPDTNTATVNQITAGIYKGCIISIPSGEEQNKISLFMDLVKRRIETQNKIIGELNSLRKTIINTLIERAYARGNIVAVEKCVKDYNDKTIHDAEYPVLSSTAGGIFFQNDYFKKEAASEDTTGYKKVPHGYCTYRSMSDTGRFFFNIQDITNVGIVSPAYPVFSVKDNSALFLITILNNDEKVINSILKQKAGGTRFSLPFNKLCKIQIPWPEKNERSQFIDFISLLNNKVDIEKKILSKYLEQKNYLLSNLFI